ncbi:MAG TPA: hypothetical protein VL122_09795 [Nitrospirota bacterium]|nr:hypothetical protein [Nitrospirota bacterium]
MSRNALLWLFLLHLSAGLAVAGDNVPADKDRPTSAQEKKEANPDGAKKMSGMSIVGNDEAPKALYIVPWKSSEMGEGEGFDMVLDASDTPVDRDVFKRQLEFYEQSTKK